MGKKNIVSFRCRHRHSALTHPNCYKEYLDSLKKEIKFPKILIFDLETAPLKAFVFQKSVWRANISDESVISDWYTLCWSAKWLYEDEILSDRLTPREVKKEDDSRIIKSLYELIDSADIVIAHNGDSFDIPNMNTRFIINGLRPPLPYKAIDTLSIARRQFGFTHNSLNALLKLFGLDPKHDVTFDLWKRCTDGDEDALEKMERYNRNDVGQLEELYLKLRPWIRSHPNIGLYMLSDGTVCPNCGSKNITWVKDKYYYTGVSRFPIFRCECGAYGRSRKSAISKEDKKALAAALARH